MEDATKKGSNKKVVLNAVATKVITGIPFPVCVWDSQFPVAGCRSGGIGFPSPVVGHPLRVGSVGGSISSWFKLTSTFSSGDISASQLT